jgi:hypothetical protein
VRWRKLVQEATVALMTSVLGTASIRRPADTRGAECDAIDFRPHGYRRCSGSGSPMTKRSNPRKMSMPETTLE